LSKIDIFLVILILIGAFSGYKQGFLMELFSVVAVILGIFGGFKLMGEAMELLQKNFNADKSILPYIAFGVVFLIIVIGVMLVARMLKASIDKTFLGKMDAIMGSLLGVFKIVFLASVILWILTSVRYSFPETWTKDSVVYPFIARIAPGLARWMAQFLPFFSEIFNEIA
jgi:membrane protein required for colicin V production